LEIKKEFSRRRREEKKFPLFWRVFSGVFFWGMKTRNEQKGFELKTMRVR